MNPDPIAQAMQDLLNKNLAAAEIERLKADLENCRIGLRVKQDEAARLKADLEKSDFAVWTLSNENARLKDEVAALRKELADAQENYHLLNERFAIILKQQSRE